MLLWSNGRAQRPTSLLPSQDSNNWTATALLPALVSHHGTGELAVWPGQAAHGLQLPSVDQWAIDRPRTSAILRTLASHAASPGLPQARMPGSVPVTPLDISIIRLQVEEEPEWCDLLQEAWEKKEWSLHPFRPGMFANVTAAALEVN